MKPPSHLQLLSQQQKPDGFPVMKQRWSHLAFYHWDFDPQIISPRLPKGLHMDTFENRAWIGIVPFLMQRVRPCCLPPVPWLSWFHELNLRTYVHDDNGIPGVWFFSLDCNQPLAVEIARRFFHLPYQHATMGSVIKASCVHYHSQRKNHPSPTAQYIYPKPKNPQPAQPHSLEHFLVERYTLFSADPQGNLYSGRVHHTPYQIEPFTSTDYSTTPFSLNKLHEPKSLPASILTASPVNVTIYPLRRHQHG